MVDCSMETSTDKEVFNDTIFLMTKHVEDSLGASSSFVFASILWRPHAVYYIL